VLPAIKFNNQFFLKADEINDVTPDWLLSAELVPLQLPRTQVLPELLLCICGLSSKCSGF